MKPSRDQQAGVHSTPRGLVRVRSVPRVAAGVAATTALAVAGAGAAHGQQLSYADGASDVHVFQADDSTVLVGDMVNTDVTSVMVDHRNRRLKAKYGFTDLAHSGVGFVAVLHLRTSERDRFNVLVVASSTSWRGGAVLETWNGRELECGSLRRTIDYDANTVKVSLGTDCLGKPRWVQVAMEAASVQAEDNLVYIDDAQHADVPAWGTWSSKIRRG